MIEFFKRLSLPNIDHNFLSIVKLFSSPKNENDVSEKFIVEMIKNLKVKTLEERLTIYREALATNNIKIRQTIAKAARQVPEVFKADYETLLNDNSYATKEIALFTLWKSFPESRKTYLDQTKNIQGFNDKSFRILWLTLAIVTKEYSGNNTPYYYKELSGYTHPRNHFEVRQNAFRFLSEIQSFSDQNLADLVNGAMHHNWRFTKFCRELLDTILQNTAYAENINRAKALLSEKEKAFLEKRMKE
jgi:aminopeptidase N